AAENPVMSRTPSSQTQPPISSEKRGGGANQGWTGGTGTPNAVEGMYAGDPGANDHGDAAPCRIRVRPAHGNWISWRRSRNSGASLTWWNRRNSARTVPATSATTSQRGQVSGSASGLVTCASADPIDRVAATGVDAFCDLVEVAGVRALDRRVLGAQHHVVHLIAI